MNNLDLSRGTTIEAAQAHLGEWVRLRSFDKNNLSNEDLTALKGYRGEFKLISVCSLLSEVETPDSISPKVTALVTTANLKLIPSTRETLTNTDFDS